MTSFCRGRKNPTVCGWECVVYDVIRWIFLTLSSSPPTLTLLKRCFFSSTTFNDLALLDSVFCQTACCYCCTCQCLTTPIPLLEMWAWNISNEIFQFVLYFLKYFDGQKNKTKNTKLSLISFCFTAFYYFLSFFFVSFIFAAFIFVSTRLI